MGIRDRCGAGGPGGDAVWSRPGCGSWVAGKICVEDPDVPIMLYRLSDPPAFCNYALPCGAGHARVFLHARRAEYTYFAALLGNARFSRRDRAPEFYPGLRAAGRAPSYAKDGTGA